MLYKNSIVFFTWPIVNNQKRRPGLFNNKHSLCLIKFELAVGGGMAQWIRSFCGRFPVEPYPHSQPTEQVMI